MTLGQAHVNLNKLPSNARPINNILNTPCSSIKHSVRGNATGHILVLGEVGLSDWPFPAVIALGDVGMIKIVGNAPEQ